MHPPVEFYNKMSKRMPRWVFTVFFVFLCITFHADDLFGDYSASLTNADVDDYVNCTSCCLTSDSVKKIFNEKKRAVVRVVCLSTDKIDDDAENGGGYVLAGSGFFVSNEAYVVSAASIVRNAQKVWVDYMGTSYIAECIGVDDITNVAVLRLLQSPTSFVCVDLNEPNGSNLTEIGSFVVFVGCKMGMDPLPDIGLISGKNVSYSDNSFLTTYLRTNFDFSGGESGAPVFEIDGKLSGMMIASLPEIRSSFVLPKRALAMVFNSIVKDGHVDHASLGIEVRPECRFNSCQEMVISKVIPGSTAELAGIKVGDVLKKIDDAPISYKEDILNVLFFHEMKDDIRVEFVRDGETSVLSVKPEKYAE